MFDNILVTVLVILGLVLWVIGAFLDWGMASLGATMMFGAMIYDEVRNIGRRWD